MFVVLIFISLIISLIQIYPAIEDAFKKKPAVEIKGKRACKRTGSERGTGFRNR